MRAYVSDEMLAETSRTTTPLDDAGSGDPASAGCRNEPTRNATMAATATAGERKPEPPHEGCSPLERGTVAEWDRGRPTSLRPSAGGMLDTVGERRRVGRPGLRSRPRDAGGRASQLGLADDPRGQARRPPAVGGVARCRLAQEPDGALGAGRRRIARRAIGPRSPSSGAASTIAPAARRPTPRSASTTAGGRGRDAVRRARAGRRPPERPAPTPSRPRG